jgi:hypothetical protein
MADQHGGRRQGDRANASVDLGEEDRHAAGGEVRDVVDGGLSFLGSEASLQRVHVLERQLGDALIRELAPVRRRDALRSFEPLQARDSCCERRVRVGVLPLEGVRILRGPVEHDRLDHGASFRASGVILRARLADGAWIPAAVRRCRGRASRTCSAWKGAVSEEVPRPGPGRRAASPPSSGMGGVVALGLTASWPTRPSPVRCQRSVRRRADGGWCHRHS